MAGTGKGHCDGITSTPVLEAVYNHVWHMRGVLSMVDGDHFFIPDMATCIDIIRKVSFSQLDPNRKTFCELINSGNEGRSYDTGTAALTPEVSTSVIELVGTKFRPEFLNRLTQLVIFQPLTCQNFVGIVELMPVRLAKRVKGTNGVTLIIGDDAKLFVANLAYGSAQLGAHQVETLLDEHIGMPIGNMLLSRISRLVPRSG
ncbi:hypothetical protein Pelo_15645 [Pelomyxa schiedti]|nr:hypothetical protein Pelo_15645 [Pelomyxa schiedti]